MSGRNCYVNESLTFVTATTSLLNSWLKGEYWRKTKFQLYVCHASVSLLATLTSDFSPLDIFEIQDTY
jgi:hypothetical protein